MTRPDAPRRSWEEVEGWFDYRDVYDAALQRFPDGSTFVEVGCWMGRSTVYMAQRLRELGRDLRFFAVDTFEGSLELAHRTRLEELARESRSLREIYETNLRECGVEGWVTTIVAPSVEAARRFPRRSVDFCMIDASHRYEDVRRDIRAWRRRMRPGGILAGDDIQRSEVRRAVEKELGSDYTLSEGPWKSWIHLRP